jgi:phospholipase C
LVISYDEWGGFFDHVAPPLVVDDTVRPDTWGPHPDYRQLGFRVPNVVASPFSPMGQVGHDGGGPFEHTSVLKMIEWRWGLEPLTARDHNARNLADMLDFSLRRTDVPVIPQPGPAPPQVCGVNSTAARRPEPVAVSPADSPGADGGGGLPGTTSALPLGPLAAAAVAAGGAAVAGRVRGTPSAT